MASPLVTVVVVCHNNWPDLDLALESALNQTHQPIEVIVVDNGSTDATQTQVQARFAHRVRYIRQPNLDLAGGRNTGLRLAQGEYVQLLDGDDLLAPTKIARQVEFLEANPEIDLAIGRFRCFRSTPDVPAAKLFDYDARPIADARALFLDRCPAPPITFLFRKRVVDRIGLQDERLTFSEDYDWWLRAAFAGFQFAVTPESWSFYRRRMGQKTEFRINSALGDYACFTRALRFVRDEPYRGMLLEKLARMLHSLGHYYLYRGDLNRARKLLRRSARMWPASAAEPPKRWAEWLTCMPGGGTMYKAARRFKGLKPPFAFDPDASARAHVG
ncbi:MAG TPA: glycosyltransferase [Planctomycetia bacterium]|nr:glycosyltransferase [Planctomycetia bacterium]